MADSATIVAASLDSSQLEQSINKLVATVASKTKEMADNFTKEVGRMEQAVKNLGNIKIDSGGTSDGGSSRRTSKQKEEEGQVKATTQAYKEQRITLDQQASAMQNAIGKKNGGSLLKKDIDEAASSYTNLIQQIQRTQAKFDVSPIQNLRMRQHELEAGMQTAANEAAKAKKDVDELNAAISNYRKTLETLPKNQQGFANRQAIQKEINDLITLRDASVSEQQKWTNAGRVLAAQYESVKGEIKQIGQALIDSEKSEKQVTSELDKQLQKIKEINSSKSAKAAYESISSMPTNTIDQVEVKLQALQALKEKVANTPLLSKSSQSQLTQAITDTKGRIEQIEMAARGTNQSKKSLDELNAAIIQNIRREEERRNAILQTGIAAQEAFAKIRQSTQIQLADNTDKPIMGVKELTEAIRNMERAYWGMDAVNRESPLGQALKRDIDNAIELRKNIDAFNRHLAGISFRGAKGDAGAVSTLGSYTELSNILKSLTDEYRKLGREERNATKGNDLADKIQRLGRETQKIQQQMNRPINLDAALKGSEKTIDDITYKIRRLQSYKVGIDLTKPNAANEIKQVDEAILRLQKDMDKYLGKSKDILASNNALGRSWNYMKNRLAFYFTVGASTQFIKNLIDIRGQYELLERSIGILINSAQNGSQIFAELNSMAIKSPFTTMELGAAAKQLVAYDVAAKDVVETTRRLADMAAAVGIPIERLTYALGQIKAYGYLNARDARMFANAGIPLVKELADRYTELEGRLVSASDVYDRIKKKAISYEDVMATVNKMTDEGGKFFNFQEKAADTLKVRIANLTLAWNNMMNEMGAANQGVLSSGLKTLSDVFKNWRSIYNLITSIIVTFGILKGTQIAVLTMQAMKLKENITLWNALEISMQKSIGAAFVNKLRSIGGLLAKFANPVYLAAAAVTALSVALLKTFYDYQDLVAANEAFNKSISDNAKENVESINKFFEDYKKQFSNVGGLNSADQEKLWERIQEEIEKTTKNAKEYIGVLNEVAKTSSKIQFGEEILEHSKTMQDELKRLADSGTFSIGGGFANDSAAENLQKYQEALNEIRQEYGSVDAAIEAHTLKSRKLMAEYQTQRDEARKELNDFVSKLDSAYIPDILGQSDDVRIQMANVRSFAESLRDAFLATEKGSKIGADGIVMLNNAIDKWITKQCVANNLIVNANGEFDEQRVRIENNKTAWEEFFRYISNKDKEYLDAAIKTNNIGSDEVKKIWDKAAEEMSKRATTSYELIQDQIAELRNTPDIVINVVYKNAKQKLDKDQEEFEKRFILPEGTGAWSTDEYLKKEKENREKYGTLMRKQGEDTVEYEKRISDERKTNLELQKKNGNIIEENKNKTDAYSQSVTEQARKEKKAADDRLKAIKEIEDAGGYDFSTKSENTAARKAQKQAESELAKALKDELSTIDKVRSIYKDLTKEGMSHADAVAKATRGWDETVNAINKVLQKNGLKKLNLSEFVGTDNPRKMLKTLQAQLEEMVKRGASTSEIKVIQEKIRTLEVDADKYDLTKITKGLNNQLDRLKDEYELAVSLDADPELGNMFADWMGIDMDDLPRTASEYAKRYTDILNKKLKEYNANIELPNLLNITDDDLRELQNRVGTGGITQTYVDDITKAVKNVRDVFRKEKEDTSRDWNALIEKYGGLQAKLLKIYKDNVQQQASIVREFGTNDEQIKALDLISKIKISQDPAEIARLQEELAKVMNDVTSRNPVALKTYQAVRNEQESQTGKAYWEDFKDSDLYSMTFTDMANNSTQAIQMIIDKLNELKDKVKEDPASMKALIKSLEDAEDELMSRDPFAGIANSIKDWTNATKEQKDAQEELKQANIEVAGSETALKNAQSVGDKEAIAKAEQQLVQAQQKQATAQGKVIQSGNKAKKAQEQLKNSLQNLSNELGNVSGLLGSVSQIFRAVGDDDTADAIDAINQGFTIMTTVISAVTAALVILKSSNPWLLAMAAALSVIVGLVSFLSGNSNKKITEQVEASERAVKRLELAHVDLQQAVDKAYGTATIGAKQATLANKELQLAEIQRQIQLEKSRTGKNRDEDKIIDLQKQYKELFYEIKNGYTEIVDDLMGTNVASFAENLVSSMIDAFKQGEDYMKVFSDKFDEMIDNMIMKSIVSRVVSQSLDKVWSDLNERINNRSKNELETLSYATKRRQELESMGLNEYWKDLGRDFILGDVMTDSMKEEAARLYEQELAYVKELERSAQKTYDAASAFTDSDIDYVMGRVTEIMPELGEKLQNIIGQYYKFGESSETQLSALQQGISQISEPTANALEAYANSISQQAYLRNDLLTQIRDAVVGFNLDVQVATMSQILLQLQSSYTVQMSIQGILEGWSSPSGLAVRVEMQ